jgi:dTDP-4-amino-4,6-dideoxygalactose transaminase
MKARIRTSYLPFGRPNIGRREIAAAVRVLRSGWIGMGGETLAFEEELAAYIDAPHVVCVDSCTSALFLALLVNNVRSGDEVICPSLTWCSSANAALYLGARPVFCDVDPGTLCLTPQTVRARLTTKTRAVVAVHFGGLAVDIAALRSALPRRVAIVEDAAHALGAAYPDGRCVGSSGGVACFSFYPNKNLATAEGGAVAVPDAATANHLRSLRQHAFPADAWKRFTHASSLLLATQLTELGFKMGFTNLQAAIARVQLARQSEFRRRRLAIARLYVRRLSGLDRPPRFQDDVCNARHARHLFTMQLPAGCSRLQRDRLLLALRKRNIGATVHYAPLHRMPLYGMQRDVSLPVTESVCDRIMTLPISSSMSPADAGNVADHVIELLG